MPLCGARKRQCRECEHRFTKSEYELLTCPECGADRLCRNHVKHEGDRCRFHGGASPKGIMSPHFVHGNYSRYLPDRLAERYEEAVTDQELLNMRGDVALLRARLTELMSEIDTGTSADLWLDLQGAFNSLRQAMQKQDARATRRALTTMEGLIAKGAKQATVWTEIYEVLEQTRKLKESEQKRLVDMTQMIPAERALTMIAAIQAVIQEHVQDDRTLAHISEAFRELATRNTGRELTSVTRR